MAQAFHCRGLAARDLGPASAGERLHEIVDEHAHFGREVAAAEIDGVEGELAERPVGQYLDEPAGGNVVGDNEIGLDDDPPSSNEKMIWSG